MTDKEKAIRARCRALGLKVRQRASKEYPLVRLWFFGEAAHGYTGYEAPRFLDGYEMGVIDGALGIVSRIGEVYRCRQYPNRKEMRDDDTTK